MKLYIGNLSYDTTEAEVREILEEFGPIVDLHMPVDRDSGRPRGFVFVTFSTKELAEAAMAKLDGFDFGGRNLRVREAEDRRTDNRGGGGGGGGRPRSSYGGREGGGGGYRGGRGGGGGGGRDRDGGGGYREDRGGYREDRGGYREDREGGGGYRGGGGGGRDRDDDRRGGGKRYRSL